MQGNPQVIEYFKNLLRGELAARDQYFVHSRTYEDLGFIKLYTRLDHEMQEETQHADALLRRILFLEGDPDMRPEAFTAGKTVEATGGALFFTFFGVLITPPLFAAIVEGAYVLFREGQVDGGYERGLEQDVPALLDAARRIAADEGMA